MPEAHRPIHRLRTAAQEATQRPAASATALLAAAPACQLRAASLAAGQVLLVPARTAGSA
jgi:hypothetical protein